MMKHTEQNILPYTQEQLFDFIADVERYAEFVPWWVAAKVYHEGDVVHVEQVFNFGSWLQYRFSSQAVLERPVRIHIMSSDGPFLHLDIQWDFQPLLDSGCRIVLSTEFYLRSGMLQKLFDSFSPRTTWRLFEAFETRAHQLYGTPFGDSV
jgi:coenzyme Q-binding protein COQ10